MQKQSEIMQKDIFQSYFHPSFMHVYERIERWTSRFPDFIDSKIFNELILLYGGAEKKFLDHRSISHVFRLILSIYLLRKKLQDPAIYFTDQHAVKVRWIPAKVRYPFIDKSVLGCLVGFKETEEEESFDESNLMLILENGLSSVSLVPESTYTAFLQDKKIRIFYLEIEKNDRTPFSLDERTLLKEGIEEKIIGSLKDSSPLSFLKYNNEDLFKNIITLSKEIQTIEDIPQVCINFDHQKSREIIFRVSLAYVMPSYRFSLKENFFNSKYVPYRSWTIKVIDGHPVRAAIFNLHIPFDPSLMNKTGSLNFYKARQQARSIINHAIGEFRDYNGGLIIKQHEMFQDFKDFFSNIPKLDSSVLEAFFFSITPVEKQATMRMELLCNLFNFFIKDLPQEPSNYSTFAFKVHEKEHQTYLLVRGDSLTKKMILDFLEEQSFASLESIYSMFEIADGFFFSCIFSRFKNPELKKILKVLMENLQHHHKKRNDQQTLKIAIRDANISLDPRFGGLNYSDNFLKLLFEGLLRFKPNGEVENALAQSIEISPCKKKYTFKLRFSLWNDGSPVTAEDFIYSWKKVLDPNFKTSLSFSFFPIKNAKEAKEGKIPMDQVGIRAVDSQTLQVELNNPAPAFLQLVSLPIFFPVHRFKDQRNPEWPHQYEKSFPCNGPFQPKTNLFDHGFQFEKNPYYWQTHQVSLNQINFIKIKNPHHAIHSLKQQKVDWIGNPFGIWDRMYNNHIESGELITFLSYDMVCWFTLNNLDPLFKCLKLRQAFAFAIERPRIIKDVYVAVKPAYSLFPRFSHHCSVQFPQRNIEKAKQLFQEALQELNLNEKEFPSLNLIFIQNSIHETIAFSIKQQLKDFFNIDCILEPCTWDLLWNKMKKKQYQIGLMSWFSVIDDPTWALGTFKYALDDINFPSWEHSAFRNLIHLGEQEVNPLQRSLYLQRAEELLTQEVPAVPLTYHAAQALISKKLNDICRTESRSLNLSYCFFKNEM